jgi:hypothetical protein
MGHNRNLGVGGDIQVIAYVAQALGGLGRRIIDVVDNSVLGYGDAAYQDGGRKNKQQLKKPAHVYFLQLVGWNLSTSTGFAEVSFAPHPFRCGDQPANYARHNWFEPRAWPRIFDRNMHCQNEKALGTSLVNQTILIIQGK